MSAFGLHFGVRFVGSELVRGGLRLVGLGIRGLGFGFGSGFRFRQVFAVAFLLAHRPDWVVRYVPVTVSNALRQF